VATHPDIAQRSIIFWVFFTNKEMNDSEDHPDARSSRLDVVQFWENLLYFGKAVAKDQPDAA
jgi:hypothetical protein